MKTSICLCFFFLLGSTHTRAAEISLPGDTLLHTMQDGIPHTVYIEKNRDAAAYRELTDFSFSKYQQEEFDVSYGILKKKHPEALPRRTSGLPQFWLPLYLYKGNYYAYAPCDRGFTGRRILSDSLLIYQYSDGPFPYLIDSIREVAPQHFILKTTPPFNYADIITKPLELHLYILDPENQTAIWASKDEKSNEYKFRLYVAANHVGKFDLIVNECLEKEMEFDFENIDFKALLKTNGFQLP